ncbi:MAG: iron-sulfur cluster assembly accessory protein [Verrucomicrobiota bacterium JB022]|nr:iron-sulfur cluster assembly accessory protein [Verrucomicrobiota bacterium JB022]
MITLTQRAARKVQELQGQANPGESLRLFITSGGCSGFEYGMTMAAAGPKDEAVTSEGITIFVERKSLERLSGSVVDFDDGLMGKGFSIQNPNAESTCGCGRSFS